MAITFVCVSECAGCGTPVNVWFDGLHHVMREHSMVESPVHLCHEPTRRERIEYDDFRDLLDYRCPNCNDQNVALTSWGRIVDFPCQNLSEESWAEAWVGPLTEHVCLKTVQAVQANVQARSRRPVEAFRVWTDGC